jgi:molecular chaperone Hsp33
VTSSVPPATRLNDDRVLPYTVSDLDVRGRIVRLGPSIDAVLKRHAYPEPVSRLLGEAATLTVLLGSSLKFQGRFQLQTKTDGPVNMLVVDFEAPDSFRAVARFDADRVAGHIAAGDISPGSLLGHGHLGMTVDQGSHASRYQGIVALEGQGLEVAAHQYFRQSEQIPTRVRLAVGQTIDGDGPVWRGGGLIAQFMPHSPERQKGADIAPGDLPEGYEAPPQGHPDGVSDDAWNEARALAETVEDHELLDPTLESERLLYRLFNERGVQVFQSTAVREACSCSRERIMEMLRGFSLDDRRHMIADDGTIGITCEFCSQHYSFDPETLEAELSRSE